MKAEKSDPPEPPPRNPLRVMASITNSLSSEVNFKWSFLSVKIHMAIKRSYRKRPSRPRQRRTGWKLKRTTRVPKRQRIRRKLKRKKMTHRLRLWRKFQVRVKFWVWVRERSGNLISLMWKLFSSAFLGNKIFGGKKSFGFKGLRWDMAIVIMSGCQLMFMLLTFSVVFFDGGRKWKFWDLFTVYLFLKLIKVGDWKVFKK